MPADTSPDTSPTSASSATGVAPIAPDDAADLPSPTIALDVASTVRVIVLDGSVGDVTISPGQAFPPRVVGVWATGTSATGIVGLCSPRDRQAAFPERRQHRLQGSFRKRTAGEAGVGRCIEPPGRQ